MYGVSFHRSPLLETDNGKLSAAPVRGSGPHREQLPSHHSPDSLHSHGHLLAKQGCAPGGRDGRASETQRKSSLQLQGTDTA